MGLALSTTSAIFGIDRMEFSMKAFQTFLLAAIVLGSTACASNAVKHQAVPSAAGIQQPVPAMVVSTPPNAMPAPSLAAPHSQDAASTIGGDGGTVDVAATEASSKAEPESEATDTQVSVRDPWEGFNRKMHSFNNAADKFVLRPLAVGYKKITPEPIRAGVSRFFANLSMPATVVNQVLQGRPGDSAQSLGRFAVNTTIGIVGVFDPASHFGIPKRDGEDFGQTLATWGWRDSRYLVLPLLGPRTVRDAVGIVGDQPLSPISRLQDSGAATGLQLMEIVDVRTRMLPIDKFRSDALDDYIFVRDAWSQRRYSQIEQDLRSNRD